MSAPARLGVTPTQTVGPFFSPALLRDVWNVLTTDATAGERIRLEGRVIDGAGNTVPDALLEIWQANAAGRFNHPRDTRDVPLDPAFGGFGRAGTDEDGAYWFETVKPGPVPFSGSDEGADVAMQAPHISLVIHARGLLNHVQTRIYFEDEAANDTDPVLLLVPADRRKTLLAQRDESGGSTVYRLDIVLQGRGETVFFNI